MTSQQALDLYSLVAESKELDAQLACDFQHPTRQEAVDWLATQASAQETINVGRIAHAAAFAQVSATQSTAEIDNTLQQLRAEVNPVMEGYQQSATNPLTKI